MIQDEHWDKVRRAALAAGIREKEGGPGPMREFHRQMYDEAKTAAECLAVQDAALKEVARIAAEPKLLTLDERMTVLESRLNA